MVCFVRSQQLQGCRDQVSESALATTKLIFLKSSGGGERGGGEAYTTDNYFSQL